MNYSALFSVYIAYLLNFVYSPSGLKKGPISTFLTYVFVVIQSLSHVQLFVTPWTAARQASMSFTISQSLLKLMSIQSVMPSNLRWLDEIPLSLSSLPAPGLSQWDSSSHQVTEVLEFQVQHQSFQWVFSVNSFRINWFDLLAVQGTLKSILQHHSLKVSILLYESESEVTQLCLTLCHPVDCSLPGSSVHGILQARILEWVVISFCTGSSRLRDRSWVSRIVGRRFNLWATREAPTGSHFKLFSVSNRESSNYFSSFRSGNTFCMQENHRKFSGLLCESSKGNLLVSCHTSMQVNFKEHFKLCFNYKIFASD